MGQDQSQNKSSNKITVNQFPFENKLAQNTIENLLRTQKYHKVTKNEAELENRGEKFKFKSVADFHEPHSFTGYAEICNKENIKIFEGDFVEGYRCGYGIEYDLSGEVLYEGYFEKNLYHGWGVTPRYAGEYQKGEKSGWGVFEDMDRNGTTRLFYEGFWKNNHFHGIGALNVRPGEIEQFLQNNPNISLNQYQAKYVGQWDNGVINGSGKMVRKGEIYTGEFVDGHYEGDGILFSQHKPPVKGKFLQGKLIKSG